MGAAHWGRVILPEVRVLPSSTFVSCAGDGMEPMVPGVFSHHGVKEEWLPMRFVDDSSEGVCASALFTLGNSPSLEGVCFLKTVTYGKS